MVGQDIQTFIQAALVEEDLPAEDMVHAIQAMEALVVKMVRWVQEGMEMFGNPVFVIIHIMAPVVVEVDIMAVVALLLAIVAAVVVVVVLHG
jgi:hypothetical protein